MTRQIIGLPILLQLADHAGEKVGDVGGHALSAAKAHGHGRVERAEDVAHRIHQKNSFFGLVGSHAAGVSITSLGAFRLRSVILSRDVSGLVYRRPRPKPSCR